ncbi:MAG: LysR family transcriptional regulator [Burkholderiaceae bacterium]
MRSDFDDGELGFDLRALRTFLVVCETGSMTTAAERLGLTQPAISQAIRSLEAAIGSPLFDRSLRPLGLTAAGATLHEHGTRLFERARQIVPAVKLSSETRLSSLRVGLVDSIAALAAPVLAQELSSFASHISIWSGLSVAHGTALIERNLDLIVTAESLDDYDGFDRYQLVQEPFLLLLPKRCDGIDFSTLQEVARQLPLVRFSKRSHIGRMVDRHLRRIGIDVPRTLEVDTSEQLSAVVAQSSGWSLTTPLCALQAYHLADRLAFLPLPPPGFSRRLTLVTRTGELGRIPQRVAAITRRMLQETCLPRIDAAMPWTTEQFRVG